MKKLLTLLTCLFLLSPNVVLGEMMDDMPERGGLFYKKFTDINKGDNDMEIAIIVLASLYFLL